LLSKELKTPVSPSPAKPVARFFFKCQAVPGPLDFSGCWMGRCGPLRFGSCPIRFGFAPFQHNPFPDWVWPNTGSPPDLSGSPFARASGPTLDTGDLLAGLPFFVLPSIFVYDILGWTPLLGSVLLVQWGLFGPFLTARGSFGPDVFFSNLSARGRFAFTCETHFLPFPFQDVAGPSNNPSAPAAPGVFVLDCFFGSPVCCFRWSLPFFSSILRTTSTPL